MARRKANGQPLSLFSFQDIITGVAGVMIFILMLLVVQLATRNSRAAAAQSQPTHSTSELEKSLREQQLHSQDLAQLIASKQTASAVSKTRIDLLLGTKILDLDKQLQDMQKNRLQLQSQLREAESALDRLQRENEKSKTDNPSRSLMEKTESLREELKSTANEILEWQDETRVNYKSDTTVKNLQLFDLHGSYFTLSKLPSDTKSRRVPFSTSEKSSQIAASMSQEYERLSKELKDPERRIVVLFRPSAAKHGSEVVRELRRLGFEVAMELLEAKADLFRRSEQDSNKSGDGDASDRVGSKNE